MMECKENILRRKLDIFLQILPLLLLKVTTLSSLTRSGR
jgi:hypothetical protein